MPIKKLITNKYLISFLNRHKLNDRFNNRLNENLEYLMNKKEFLEEINNELCTNVIEKAMCLDIFDKELDYKDKIFWWEMHFYFKMRRNKAINTFFADKYRNERVYYAKKFYKNLKKEIVRRFRLGIRPYANVEMFLYN